MIGTVPGQIGGVAYGVCFLGAKGIDYLCGVEISANSKTSADLSVVEVPAQTYAVFEHPGHVSTLRETMEEIENKWLPASGCKPVPKAAGAPDFFERYGEDFIRRPGSAESRCGYRSKPCEGTSVELWSGAVFRMAFLTGRWSTPNGQRPVTVL